LTKGERMFTILFMDTTSQKLNIKIADLPRVDRPREKLEKDGPGKLSTSELLAIILRTGFEGTNVVELSKKILQRFGEAGLASATLDELREVKGLGGSKALQILAGIELGKRVLKGKKSALVLSPQDVWNELKEIRNHKKEHFVVFYLDTRNQEIKREVISVGTLNANLVHPREVFEPAIQSHCAQIIVSHNHPSGDPEPSEEDLQITRRLQEAGNILGIELLDHIIIARETFLSFKEKNLL